MRPEDFEKKLSDLKKPSVEEIKPPREIKLAVVNAQRSAAIGAWFVAVPCYFLFCVVMKYYFHLHIGLFNTMIEMMSQLDKSPAMRVLSPILLVGLPVTGVVLNALAIMHFSFVPATRSLLITIKLRWINLVVMSVSLCLVAIFLLYAIVENIHHAQSQ